MGAVRPSVARREAGPAGLDHAQERKARSQKAPEFQRGNVPVADMKAGAALNGFPGMNNTTGIESGA